MTDILVGGPVAGRAWILPYWRDAVEAAMPVGVRPKYVFAVPTWDTETLGLVESWPAELLLTKESVPDGCDLRRWADKDRYHEMTILRNYVLRYVRRVAPNFFLSLDSDILLAPDALKEMIETYHVNQAHAVGGFTFLDPIDPTCTNLAQWVNPDLASQFRRVESPGQHPVDIIMAVKLMGNLAYNINYQYHDYGEDFGWAVAARRAKARIFCDGRSPSKHVMNPKWLDIVDKRVGY